MNLDDLNNLDLNNPSSWPLPVKIGAIAVVCIGLLVGGWFFIIQGELDELKRVEVEEEKLRQTYLDKKALAINLPAYKQQMVEMEQTFGSLLRQLPDSAEVPDLLVDITQAGLGRGLEFILFKPGKERPAEFYAELPISLKVKGSYHELAQFISDVAALPRIVTFGNIQIVSKKSGGELTMSATAKTYRYLDASEIAKSSKGKKKRRKRRR
ncbi:MAG: type 4a pilus biogenesis protein PilO [Gammaproteobacteria bacterium]|nr:MAG: type 4a pilus biogenesis protein PilO [Gammaproteobacteria bacterium]